MLEFLHLFPLAFFWVLRSLLAYRQSTCFPSCEVPHFGFEDLVLRPRENLLFCPLLWALLLWTSVFKFSPGFGLLALLICRWSCLFPIGSQRSLCWLDLCFAFHRPTISKALSLLPYSGSFYSCVGSGNLLSLLSPLVPFTIFCLGLHSWLEALPLHPLFIRLSSSTFRLLFPVPRSSSLISLFLLTNRVVTEKTASLSLRTLSTYLPGFPEHSASCSPDLQPLLSSFRPLALEVCFSVAIPRRWPG